MSTVGNQPAELDARAAPAQSRPAQSDYGATLAITATLAVATALILMAAQLLVIHPNLTGLEKYVGLVNQQNQSVKTDMYVGSFVVILPLALLAGLRLDATIARGANAGLLQVFAAVLTGSLAALVIVIRRSGTLPWGSGIKAILAGTLVWAVLAGWASWRIVRGSRWAPLAALQKLTPIPEIVAAVLVFCVLLCLTSSASLGLVPLVIGVAVAAGAVAAYGRVRLRRAGRWGWALDALVIVLLVLAIPDLVVFANPVGIPNSLFDPGVVQFQMDYILGPTNQLLGGGALLVNDPVSQYGVGLIYFLAGWFHLAPIGYGTFGFLDGLLTALFYGAGYAVLRLAGVRRLLAIAAIALAVLTFVYHFQYFVGQLPEEGPLRFGLPMLVLLGSVLAARSPRAAPAGRALILLGLGVSALWALEAFVYTTITFAGIVVVESWLHEPGERRRWLVRQAVLCITAWVVAQLLFALATLLGSGHLPDWGQYLAYAQEFLFGGGAGSITYGFANWSPGLAVDGAVLVSAAAIVLLLIRRPGLARANPTRLVALAGSTAYAIAALTYTDNRSSTYLLLYVALPPLIAATTWLALMLDRGTGLSLAQRRAALAAALSVVVLLWASAWPTIGGHFSRTALAHAYPGGGLGAAMTRLWHPPPIDPRAPVGEALLARYVPAHRQVILLPRFPDLGTEILIDSHRANLLPIGDPKADGLVPSVWLPRVRAALARIHTGRRILIDTEALKVIADLRNPAVHPLQAPIDGGGVEAEWILRALDQRFVIRPIARAPDGLIVAQLQAR